MTTIRRSDIESFVDGSLAFEGTVRHNYSGRGMYGKECLGIVFTDEREYTKFIKALLDEVDGWADHELLDLAKNIENVTHDSMGKRIVYYWPNITVDNDDENEDPA